MTHCMRCTSPASCDVWGCVPGTFSSEKVDPNPPPLTPGQQAILDAIPLLDSTPPEPFGEWMRQQGFPPETSLLFLPLTMRPHLPFWPEYVQFSVDVKEPTLMRRVTHAHQMWQRYRK